LKPDHFSDFIVCSSGSSTLLVRVGCPTFGFRVSPGSPSLGASAGIIPALPLDVLGQRTGVQNTGDPQRSPEGSSPPRQRETVRIGVNVRTPARPSTGRVGYDADNRRAGFSPWGVLLARRLGGVLNRDNPQ
jgi:hypothetical protein